MIKKTGLWRGLLFVFTILLAVFIAAALVMEAFRFQIDDFLGTRSQVIETTDDGTLWTAFTPDEDVLARRIPINLYKNLSISVVSRLREERCC